MSRSTARVRHTPDDDPLTLLASAIDAKIEEWPIERLSHYQARWVWPPTFKNGPEWQPFVEDIRASGIREPLIVLPDGQVVDGGHRLEAARDVPLENAPVRVLSLTLPLSDSDRFALENWAVMDTLARRQLNRHETRGLIIDIEHAMAELQRSGVTPARSASTPRIASSPEGSAKRPPEPAACPRGGSRSTGWWPRPPPCCRSPSTWRSRAARVSAGGARQRGCSRPRPTRSRSSVRLCVNGATARPECPRAGPLAAAHPATRRDAG